MKLSNLISKFQQTFARVILASNLVDSLFPHQAAKLKQSHQVNLKNTEPTQSKNDAAQAGFEVMETGVMECWSIGVMRFVRIALRAPEPRSHSSKHLLRSYSTPMAVWYRSSAVLASSFITMAETAGGTPSTR